ncbi:MAG: metal ABC transporter permease [Verrucomicrobiales bacterium]
MMSSILLEPFALPFMREAMLAGAITGVVCAVLSCFLILRGWSLMGDAISHAVLPGIVLAYVAGVPLALGAFAAGWFCAAGSGYLKERCRVKEDTLLGVVFTGLFALGLVLFTKVETDKHLNHILLGNLLGVEAAELWQSTGMAVVALILLLVFRRNLALVSFDPAHARALGIHPGRWNQFLLAILSLTIVASIQTTGILLVVAMLVAPGAMARLLTDRFDRMLGLAAASALFSSVVGTYASFFLDGSTGPCIVLVQSLLFIAAFLFGPKAAWRMREVADSQRIPAPGPTP